jgi:hypothetical protein
VFLNGVGQSQIPYGGIHTVLGALPAFAHPAPRDVAIVGLGSGDTAYAVAGRQEVVRITSIEIVGPQLATLRTLAARTGDEALRALLQDTRIEHVIGDGRTYLMRTNRQYDIIEADALRPTSAFSGNLYSDTYFELVKERLRRNGLAVTWVPTSRVHNAFVKVFPYVLSVPGVLLGSNEPFELDRDAIRGRIAAAPVQEHFGRAGIDVGQLLGVYLDGDIVRYGPEFDRAALTDFNTDLFPKDEYDLSRPAPTDAPSTR